MIKTLSRIWMWCVYAFLYIPIFVVIVYSFNNAKYSTNWKGFTLKWYEMLASNTLLLDAVANSLLVATFSATLATVLGVLAALCIRRYKFISMMIAHTTLSLPFVAVTVLARLAEFDENLIEAARDLGASEMIAFRRIMLPMLNPAILAGWLLAFTLSMDDVLISFFVAGSTFDVMPLRIYSMVRLGVKPDINALSAIMFGVTALLVLTAWFFYSRSNHRKI